MNDDEYKTLGGKSIAELHGLMEDDPWQQPETPEKRKMLDTIRKQDAIIERLRREGKIPGEDDLMPEFVDPDDDEDMRIRDSNSVELFWRMMIPNRRLKEIVTMEPDILKVGLTARNNTLGCWIVFTNRKIAERLGRSLTAKGVINDVHTCDIKGDQVGLDAPFTNLIDVEGWRPWKPVGEITEMKPEEFFYCILKEGSELRVCFVPETYWNEHHKVYDDELGIDKLLGSSMNPLSGKYYSYTTYREYMTIKLFLDERGFRENLMFHAYVIENFL